MTLTINTANFRSALTELAKVAKAKSTLPILACVRIKSQTLSGLTLEATDLETSLRIKLPGADADMDIAVPAKTLAEVVAAINDDKASLSTQDEKLLVAAKGTKARLSAQPGEDFPQFPLCSQAAAIFNAAALKRTLKKVVMAASNDQSRPALMSVQVAQDGDEKLTFAAADGFRLAAQEVHGSLKLPNKKKDILLPTQTARRLMAALPDSDETVTLSVNGNLSAACFAWGNVELFAGLLDFSFPAWKNIVPEKFAHTLDLPADFPAAVKRAEIFGREGSHLTLLSPAENGGLEVSGSSEGTGESKTTFDDVPMPSFRLGLNAVFLQQGLDAIGNGVHLHLTAPNSPAMLTNGSREYVYLIMPMFLDSPKTAEAAAAAEASVNAESQG